VGSCEVQPVARCAFLLPCKTDKNPYVCAAGGPGVGIAVKRPGSDDVHETSALQPPTTKKPAAPSAATEHADKHVN